MRRPPLPAAAVVVVLALVSAPAAAAAPAPAPRPVTWTSLTTPAVTDRTVTAEVFAQVAVVPGGGAFAVGAVQSPFAGSASYDPLVERLDGATWTRATVPTYQQGSPDQRFAGAAAVAADDAWAVGHGVPVVAPSRRAPWAVHWDGTVWSTVAVPDADPTVDSSMTAVAAPATDDVWAVGYAGSAGAAWHWDGSAWAGGAVRVAECRATSTVSFGAITVTPTGAVYAGGDCTSGAGEHGAVVARMERAGTWRVVARVASRSGVEDLAAAADGTVWATGMQETASRSRPFLLAGADSTWSVRHRPARTDGRTEQVAALALTATSVTLVGETDSPGTRAPFAVTWSGSRWLPATVTAPGGGTGWLTAVDGVSSGQVVAVGQYFDARGVMVGFSASPDPAP